ncbi:hypothetical protein HPP92_026626 [Vanilla planifolia]|uniref:DUF7795 domain-containing protein n=1 Tax=Vanilla planifolia TaxID=51239 RepID=A0A835U661_VANPL|nr:hypothetical protein HPP92_026626 [Vanilla planifolia]
MDQQHLPSELSESAATIFKSFMSRTAKLEELAVLGMQHLGGYFRVVETFRRAPLSNVYEVIDNIIKANPTDKLQEYVDSGFWNHDFNFQNIGRLCTCKEGLEDHLSKAKALLGELEILKDDAICTTHHIHDYYSDLGPKCPEDSVDHQMSSTQEVVQDSILLDSSVSRATLMAIILGMLKLDFTMQEKIIRSLNLKTSSSELESYCLLWELRPYVDDNVLLLAWKHISV